LKGILYCTIYYYYYTTSIIIVCGKDRYKGFSVVKIVSSLTEFVVLFSHNIAFHKITN